MKLNPDLIFSLIYIYTENIQISRIDDSSTGYKKREGDNVCVTMKINCGHQIGVERHITKLHFNSFQGKKKKNTSIHQFSTYSGSMMNYLN